MGEWQLEEILRKKSKPKPKTQTMEYEEKQYMPNNEQHKSKANEA